MNTNSLKITFKIMSMDVLKDINGYLNFYKKYIDVLLDITNSLSESQEQMPYYKVKIEMLLVKYCISCKSLLKLLEGTDLDSKFFQDLTLIDIPSIHIISRSLIENFLTIFYLFIEKNDNEDIVAYRNWIYELSSLAKRQKFSNNSILDKKGKKKIEQEATIIKILREKIEENKEFQLLTSSEKNKILKAKPHRIPSKIYTWTKLFDVSKLNNLLFKGYWDIYSNYAHSEFLSIMHLEGIRVSNYVLNLLGRNFSKSCMLACPMFWSVCLSHW